MREIVRRLLAWGVVLTLLLPMVIAVVLGLGGLLSSLGDQAGAAACGRVGLVVGVVWFMALAGTAAASGIMALDGNADRGSFQRPRRVTRARRRLAAKGSCAFHADWFSLHRLSLPAARSEAVGRKHPALPQLRHPCGRSRGGG